MARRQSRPPNGRRKTGVVRRRRTLNAFRVDTEDISKATHDSDEELNESDDAQVKSEDDEDIDSDEAFDESDEERFSTFKFSGSASKRGKGATLIREKADDRPSEGEENEFEDEDDDERYMDLSDMLATGQSNDKVINTHINRTTKRDFNSDDEEDQSDESEESVLEESDSEEDDGQLEKLGAFVDSLSSKVQKQLAEPDNDAPPPSLDESTELSMTDILSSLTDPSLQSFRKSLVTQQNSKSKSVRQKLSVPLARPIQARLERQAAYEETKKEVSKWQPLVKANREADHLQFPMNEPPKQSKQTTATLTGTFEPSTSLEKNIDDLLRESGIRDEKDITTFEDLALKKVSIDEVRKRQAQLRTMRELMFRQEQKAKRIAKIKSKTYRKIHKREREREKERQMAEEDSDNEKQMKLETARAKERMTLRHKATGDWAKRIFGNRRHDPETRQEILEHIQRRDDLHQKILGDDDEPGRESDSEEDLEKLLHDPNDWGENQVPEAPEIRKGVMGMKFMRDAEERQRQANAQQIAEINAAINSASDGNEVSGTEPNVQVPNPGRKSFTPGDQAEKSTLLDEDDDDRDGEGVPSREEMVIKTGENPFHMTEAKQSGPKTKTSRMATNGELSNSMLPQQSTNILPSTVPTIEQTPMSTNSKSAPNPWLIVPNKKISKKSNTDNRIDKVQNKRKRDEQENEEAGVSIDVSVEAITEKLLAARKHVEDEDAPTMTYMGGKITFQQAELVNRAFAADGVERDFIEEKEAAIAEDAPKEEDLTLPGWGSWTGQGVKRRATEKKIIKKIPGIEASKRKDAKLKHVIINEKWPKNNTKYLASGAVPYPYETREQYERSLSMPIGPEWTTREMYQKMTKPRVTVRAGAVVNPLQAPFK